MKKLISILLIVALLAICLCACQVVEQGANDEETTTPAPEETTTAVEPWAPKPDSSNEGPIELPGVGIKPTIGQ